ncbi:hypothetical protein B7P43_G03921 [Cryptotermes secundus]|uniref:Uncharacterized protein n=1 Tax=Cryptotermes secundus TaxID=105785 RepID=A0A2J7RRU5_9NEOP|nr:hypothetical protein B7P43_G03921 [Cryptotermes secundus]
MHREGKQKQTEWCNGSESDGKTWVEKGNLETKRVKKRRRLRKQTTFRKGDR